MTKPCRHIPVNKANVIASRLLPYFLKRHTLSLEGAVVFAGEKIGRELLAFDLKLPDFFEYVFYRQHR